MPINFEIGAKIAKMPFSPVGETAHVSTPGQPKIVEDQTANIRHVQTQQQRQRDMPSNRAALSKTREGAKRYCSIIRREAGANLSRTGYCILELASETHLVLASALKQL